MIRSARRTKAPAFAWVNALLERRPARLVSVALANKAARIVWVILTRGETYRAPAMAASMTSATTRLPTASRSLATALWRARSLAACSTE